MCKQECNMRVLYIAPRYHTNQIAIMNGWVEHGDTVCFLAHYEGRIEDHSSIKPIVVGYSRIFLLIEWFYLRIRKKNENAIDFRLKYGIPPLFKLNKIIKQFSPELLITRERSIYSIFVTLICRFHKYPVILYNQSPLWETSVKDDLAHKIIRKLTPSYRILSLIHIWWFDKFKQLFKDKKIVIVEGCTTHNGVGNDLFEYADSIERIICPSRNAYCVRNKIKEKCLEYSKDVLFLFSLGITAKGLVEELFLQGYRVLDIGNLDTEYEWFLENAQKKEIIPKHKVVGEEANKAAGYINYLEQIVCTISEK